MPCSSSLTKREKASSPHSAKISAVMEVEGNDDLLTIILVRLPAKSIFRFRSTSQRWNDIISTPFFRQTFSTRSPRILAYVRETYSDTFSENFHRRDSESIAIIPVPMVNIMHVLNGGINFVNSSNGLILFKMISFASYMIYNPITKRSVSLVRPHPPQYYGSPAIALVCTKNVYELVPNYKVVIAGKLKRRHSYLTINTFCSKTKEWTLSTPMATGSVNDAHISYSSCPFVVDDIIHWFTRRRLYMVVYYVGSDRVQLVELPSEYRENYCLKVAKSRGDDDLYLCCNMTESCCNIRIWMVSREVYNSYRSRSSTIPNNAWILIKHVSYSAPHPFPEEGKIRINRRMLKKGFPHKVPYVSFAMITRSLFVMYNEADSSYESVRYHPQGEEDLQTFKRYDFSPFMEAFCLSSYGL